MKIALNSVLEEFLKRWMNMKSFISLQFLEMSRNYAN